MKMVYTSTVNTFDDFLPPPPPVDKVHAPRSNPPLSWYFLDGISTSTLKRNNKWYLRILFYMY